MADKMTDYDNPDTSMEELLPTDKSTKNTLLKKTIQHTARSDGDDGNGSTDDTGPTMPLPSRNSQPPPPPPAPQQQQQHKSISSGGFESMPVSSTDIHSNSIQGDQNDDDGKEVVFESISTYEEMNPSRRCSHEDISIYQPAGSWGCPDPNMALLAICDGHGGRDMVDYLEHGLVFHVREELCAPISSTSSTTTTTTNDRGEGSGTNKEETRQDMEIDQLNGCVNGNGDDEDVDDSDPAIIDNIPLRLERAFLMADIHSKTLGVKTSGATVALCLVQRHPQHHHSRQVAICDEKNDSSNSIVAEGVRTTTETTLLDQDDERKKEIHESDTIDIDGIRKEDHKHESDSSIRSNRDDSTDSNNHITWTIHAANAGDARIVVGYNGTAYRLTHDHRADDPEEVKRIESTGGFMFKGRVLGVLAVTRSLGDHCMKDYVIANPYCSSMTVSKQKMNKGNNNSIGKDADRNNCPFIICACDGVFDVMTDQEAVDFVLNHTFINGNNIINKDKAAEVLVKEAIRRGSTDNVTVTVAWL